MSLARAKIKAFPPIMPHSYLFIRSWGNKKYYFEKYKLEVSLPYSSS
jgi:hypothetical protein